MKFYENIDLKLEAIPRKTTARRLGQAYQAGNIVATYYSKNSLPSSEELLNDLLVFINIYEQLIENQPLDAQENDSYFEEVWFEDLTKYKIHRRVERNQALCKKAKEIHGYVCKACGFDFEARYGEIGKHYIEAHHIVPIATLEKTKVKLNPSTDFTVLCSNCHRIIHRIKPTPTLEEFIKRVRI
jgi:5-methylcytosine-specific restriction protein A